MYATPTFIIEVLSLVTNAKLLKRLARLVQRYHSLITYVGWFLSQLCTKSMAFNRIDSTSQTHSTCYTGSVSYLYPWVCTHTHTCILHEKKVISRSQVYAGLFLVHARLKKEYIHTYVSVVYILNY